MFVCLYMRLQLMVIFFFLKYFYPSLPSVNYHSIFLAKKYFLPRMLSVDYSIRSQIYENNFLLIAQKLNSAKKNLYNTLTPIKTRFFQTDKGLSFFNNSLLRSSYTPSLTATRGKLFFF